MAGRRFYVNNGSSVRETQVLSPTLHQGPCSSRCVDFYRDVVLQQREPCKTRQMYCTTEDGRPVSLGTRLC